MVTLKRIGVVSAAKLEAVIMAVFGLLQGLFFAAFSALFGGSGDLAVFGMGAGLGLLAVVFLPVMYAIAGFVIGAIGAVVYNVIAGVIGGVELELSDRR